MFNKNKDINKIFDNCSKYIISQIFLNIFLEYFKEFVGIALLSFKFCLMGITTTNI